MTTFGRVEALASDLINAASRRKSIGKNLREAGFASLGKGRWLGLRSSDIVSGLIIEGGASDVYISSFILPVFDKLSFIGWSLGERLVRGSAEISARDQSLLAIERYKQGVLGLRSAPDLMCYIEENNIVGFYSVWTKYLCYLRVESLQEARKYLEKQDRSALHSSVLDRLNEIESYVNAGDATGVARILSSWEESSKKVVGHGAFSLD